MNKKGEEFIHSNNKKIVVCIIFYNITKVEITLLIKNNRLFVK